MEPKNIEEKTDEASSRAAAGYAMDAVSAALRWLKMPTIDEQEDWYNATAALYRHLQLRPGDGLTEPVALILAEEVRRLRAKNAEAIEALKLMADQYLEVQLDGEEVYDHRFMAAGEACLDVLIDAGAIAEAEDYRGAGKSHNRWFSDGCSGIDLYSTVLSENDKRGAWRRFSWGFRAEWARENRKIYDYPAKAVGKSGCGGKNRHLSDNHE